MKKLIHISFFSLIIALSYPSLSWASTIQVEIIHSQDKYQLKGAYPISFRFKISKPWYIHSTKKNNTYLISTILSFHEFPGLQVEGVRFPEPARKKFDYLPDPIEVFSGDILVEATLRVGENAALGQHVIKGNLSYQACSSKVCLLPENVPVNISVSIVLGGTPAKALNQDMFLSPGKDKGVESSLPDVKSGAGLWLTLLGIFLGGAWLSI